MMEVVAEVAMGGSDNDNRGQIRPAQVRDKP
jgi:hypothetical protein